MSNFVYNIAKGRVAELYNRVDLGDPAAARLYVIPVDVAAVTDATLIDLDDFAGIITAGVTERAANGWNRKTLDAAALAAMAPTDGSDAMILDFADQTWTPTADAVTDLIVCYAAVASPTNAQLIPLTQHDFSISGDGSLVTATVANFFQAA
jgi:hypothetical protein